jgi:hypothetical protein
MIWNAVAVDRGRIFVAAPLSGPWSRIETRWLDDFSASRETIAG